MKMIVYGRPKTGKTRLACTFPKPLLLIGTEDGTKSVATGKTPEVTLQSGNQVHTLLLRGEDTGIRFLYLDNSGELDELCGMLGSGAYASAVLDHAGNFESLLLKEYKGWSDVPVQNSFGMTNREDWGPVQGMFKDRLRQLLRLSDEVGLNVCVIAHEREFKSDNKKAEQLMLPGVGAALTPNSAGWLNGACDYMGQTFIRAEVTEREEEVTIAGKVKTRLVEEPTGRQEYCLRVGPHPIFMTGFRLPPGVQAPEAIADPSYDKILQLTKGD